ncbi:TIGR03905 family TSCPD domain-containing protein [Caproiciproducens sp. MSJ-32]|uniref:TIGR03905 family TSCPD domain-containing protein n=1 Tax=Caproiciproducens sp. MSJ-32 TaxID=2841527 RepID=UPI001C124A78|nr:TIGR03905 family TSCPD domain-containing protein [Caproiciproducens sp. MSJ-32]MBU5455027.1 TIGR03905 family TSCPD domain-containing protein [Caproiciproducens sp. MSJ-32]
MFVYKTKGVCSTEIHLEVENNLIKNVEFIRGCAGNLFGISALVKGMNIDDAISKLKGIDCKGKGTSCPDQLSRALEEYKAANL